MQPGSSASSLSSILASNKRLKKNNRTKTTTVFLKQSTECNKNCNFIWYHGRLGKKATCELLQQNGQFLVRSARSKVDLHPLTKRSKAILLQPLYRCVEFDAPYVLRGALNLAFVCAVVIFLYTFTIK
ncbi:Uncharacterized protein BM_BM1235 [Brugia malayi]|uniref:SH2 domain-containing protein n=1 Tax=Brugia malayi TaxID=6279 RepID=A0A4E9FM14_BRUMA|nr:Uncharacterized protein BM_BM1235 [Brugia malayi]VIO97492.1 Uncharacterized protein BM_BM1235 [Brugia malayi]